MVFGNSEVKAYFDSQPWYHPNPSYSETVLTVDEKHNAEDILKIEKSKGAYEFTSS